ncbi:MAG: 50S ribosomal protein L24 [Malacoplasma sp.]
MQRIKKGDKVRIIVGSKKGTEGIVKQVFPKNNTAIVEKVNVYKRHKKPDQSSEKGGITEIEVPMNMSKMAIIDPKGKGKHTRIKFGYDKNNKKVRIGKLSNTEIGKK